MMSSKVFMSFTAITALMVALSGCKDSKSGSGGGGGSSGGASADTAAVDVGDSEATSTSVSMTMPSVPSTLVNTTSYNNTIVALNMATKAVRINSITLTKNSDFKISTYGTCAVGGQILSQSSCSILFNFAPTTNGTKTDTISLNYTSSSGIVKTITGSLTATATGGVVVQPANLTIAAPANWGFVQTGTTSSAKTFTITNSGTGNGTISSRTMTSGTDFTVTGGTCTPTSVIAPNGTCTVDVVFSPKTAGAKTDSLVVTYMDTATKTVSASIGGTGLAAAVLTGSTPTFTTTIAGSTSAGVDVTFTNTGGSTATVVSRALATASDYVINSGTCIASLSLNVGQSCTVNISFAPSTSGLLNNTLNVVYNDGWVSRTAAVALSATGGAIASSSSSVTSSVASSTTSSATSSVVSSTTSSATSSVVSSTTSSATSSVASSTSSTPPPPVGGSSAFAAVWANDGGSKVAREEKRAQTNAAAVLNSKWNGTKITTFGAKNEVVGFNVVLEAGATAVNNVSVAFNTLNGPGGYNITSGAATGNGVFNWTNRNIELFYIRYLQIKGLSGLSYETYDERHVPKRMERPWTGQGYATGTWADRPDHDKYYPDIAVPLELVPTFNVAANLNQSIWVDVYVPKAAPAGLYTGSISVSEGGVVTRNIPVELTVKSFTLPETPSSKTMLYLGYGDIANRYTGTTYPNSGTTQANTLKTVRDRHFMLAHRHKISMIDSNESPDVFNGTGPRPEWIPRLNGSLFSAANGYAGPGENVGNNVYSIGTYGSWSWKGAGQAAMNTNTDAWESWFQTNSPSTERFLYLVDESTDYAQTEQWANWVKTNPGIGHNLNTFATLDLTHAVSSVPSLNLSATWFRVGITNDWQSASDTVAASTNKKAFMYNGKRPSNGSFATEDDGVALRELPWAQFKKKIARWFFWESTYYNDFQTGRGATNVFQSALTFGSITNSADTIRGQSGWNYSNGDGVLFYPGTDLTFPTDSYGVAGPIASLRLKQWRRGIQDVDYITLANSIDPVRTQAIVNRMVPKALWEYGVNDPADPTWVRSDISWSINPDDWEQARQDLSNIIEGL